MNRTMTRLTLAIFIFLRMLPSPAEAAEPGKSAAPFTLKAGGGTVDVLCPDGRLVQSLPYAGEDPDEKSIFVFAIGEDMDFDGYPDVRVLRSRAGHYDAWLWRADAGAFVRHEGLSGVESAAFDPGRKRIISSTAIPATVNSPLVNVTEEYRWEGGELILLEKTEQAFSPQNKIFSVRRYERNAEDELRLVEKITMSPEEMNAYFTKGAAPEDREPE